MSREADPRRLRSLTPQGRRCPSTDEANGLFQPEWLSMPGTAAESDIESGAAIGEKTYSVGSSKAGTAKILRRLKIKNSRDDSSESASVGVNSRTASTNIQPPTPYLHRSFRSRSPTWEFREITKVPTLFHVALNHQVVGRPHISGEHTVIP